MTMKMAAAILSQAIFMLAATLAIIALSSYQEVAAFSPQKSVKTRRIRGHNIIEYRRSSRVLSLSDKDDDDDNWGVGNDSNASYNDPRVDAMRSILESSWDGDAMGVVPSGPEKASEAAAESVALAMGQGHNVLMIDLRLPSYDIMEGPKLYDIFAAYNFCSFLSEKLRERNLIRKSLVLVRNEKERAEIGRAVRANEGGDLQANESKIVQVNDASDVSAGNDVDEFRQKLMSSWDTLADDSGGESKLDSTSSLSESKMDTGVNNDANNANVNYKSHRLWSMVGNEEISTGPDMFEQAIAAVDKHARLEVDGQSAEPEDALIILSPYDTTDVIAIRRILARYGQTRTIIIVNSRMESLPRELDPAVLVYGIMPLIARARGSNEDSSDGREAGPKVVVMRRFPKKWTVFLDVNDEGFVDVTGESPSGAEGSKTFPPIEWVVQRVQSHLENMSS